MYALKDFQSFVWGSSTSGPDEGRVAGDGKGDNLWDCGTKWNKSLL